MPINSSLTSSDIDPKLLIDRNTAIFQDENGRSQISQYLYGPYSLNLTQFARRDNLLVNESIINPILLFQYCIAGEIKLLELNSNVNELRVGECLISILNNHNTISFENTSQNTILSIKIPLEELSRSIDVQIIEKLKISTQIKNTPIEISPFTARERIILSEILNPPVFGCMKEIFIESKMLELIAIRLSNFYNKTVNCQKNNALHFRNAELEKIKYASEIISEKMDAPPNIKQLAKISGINEYKLKRGFKEVFGTTIYEYLRTIRMEKAYSLMYSGEMNVSEAAYYVGYNKAGYFSRVFRNYSGINPGKLRKKL